MERLDSKARAHPDPDMYGAYDQVEYTIGFGFVTCQTYPTAVISQSKVKPKKALTLGPMHRDGRTYVQLINAAANYWKHSPEWRLDALTPRQEETKEYFDTLKVNIHDPYPTVNFLHQLLTPHPERFAKLRPWLTQWRDELLKER